MERTEFVEALYALSGLALLLFFSPFGGFRVYTVSDRLPYEIALTFIGVFQLVALWLARKELPESVAAMGFLSSLSILALLLSIPVLGQGDLFIVTVMYLILLLNIIDLGLLSQESITSKLLHRQLACYNDGPVLILVILHVLFGFFLFVLIEFEVLPIASSLTTLGMILTSAVWIISVLLILAIPFLISRQKSAWFLFFVLDVALLTLNLVSVIAAAQFPDMVISPIEYWRYWWVRNYYADIAVAGIGFGGFLSIALVCSIPALDTDEKAVDARRESQEKTELPMQK